MFLLPFIFRLDPMERLLVTDISGDDNYSGIEPQYFDDPFNGKGLRVLRYRMDKKVDLFWERGVKIDFDSFNIGAGIGDSREVVFEKNIFEIDSKGVKVDIAFEDSNGILNELVINERCSRCKRFSFLAPVGHEIASPKQFFLAFMKEFDFIKRSSVVYFKMGGRDLTIKRFPIPRRFKRLYFIRYAGKTVISQLNPPFRALPKLKGLPLSREMYKDMEIIFDQAGGVSEIKSGFKNAYCSMSFYPSLVNIKKMMSGETIKGRFSIYNQGEKMTGGAYSFFAERERCEVILDLDGIWKPNGMPILFRMFVTLVRFFRRWPTTYHWRGIVDLAKEEIIESDWKRK